MSLDDPKYSLDETRQRSVAVEQMILSGMGIVYGSRRTCVLGRKNLLLHPLTCLFFCEGIKTFSKTNMLSRNFLDHYECFTIFREK